jgi:hypothetical protein
MLENDICKCDNDKCTIKETCYRWTVKADEWQSYSSFEQDEKGWCTHYWRNTHELYYKKRD